MTPTEVSPLIPGDSSPLNDSVDRITIKIRPGISKSSSGYVGSMVLAVFMIAVSGAQEIAVYVSDHPKYYVQIVNSLYVLLAFGILIACWTKRIKQAKSGGDREIETVVALMIFWIFGACYDYMTIGCQSHCFYDWIASGHVQRIEMIVDIFYHFIRPIYKFFLVLVYTLCMNSVFPDKRIVRYGLMFIFATNLSIWVELLFDEAVHDHDVVHQTLNSFNNISGNDTDYCFGNNSGIDQVMKIGTRICVPSMVEFTLLIVECVMHWFTHCKSKIDVTEHTAQRDMHRDIDAANNRASVCCNFKFWLNDADCCSKILFSLSFPFSIALNVLFIIFSHEASIQESFTSFIGDRYIYYSTAFWSLNILITFATYVVSRRFVSSNLSFKNLIGIERLLLLSLMGPMLMAVFSFISIFHEWYSPEFPNVQTPWKFLFQEGTNTLQILIQVPLIFYVRRINSDIFECASARESTLTVGSPGDNDGDQEVIPRNTPNLPHRNGFRDYGTNRVTHYSINEDNESQNMQIPVRVEVHTKDDAILDSDDVYLQGRPCDGSLPESDNRDVNASRRSRIINSLSQSNPLVSIDDVHDYERNPTGAADDIIEEAENNTSMNNNFHNIDVVKVNVSNDLHCITNWPKYVLLAATFHLLISNAMHWIVNNFVDPRYERLTLVKAYFNPTYWPIVASVLAPLGIFFRFHSMMLFIRAWRGLSFIKVNVETKFS